MCGLDREDQETVQLKIYIAGMTPAAKRAIRNLEIICLELSSSNQYEIEVIDILQRPALAESEKILATPTVTRELPPPIREIIGDLSDREQALIGLDLVKKDTEAR